MEYLSRKHHIIDCSTGEERIEHHGDEFIESWRVTAEATAEAHKTEAARAERRARAMKLVKERAKTDDSFAALLELMS